MSAVKTLFKVILSSALTQGKLQLPSKFVKENWDALSGSVRLFIPVGRSWRVGVERDVIEKTIWLQDGLVPFFEDNAVGVNYCLIFEYEGNSMFSVMIFDLTATEIDYICKSDSENSSNGDQIQVSDTEEEGSDECNNGRPIESLAPETDSQFPQMSEEQRKRRKCVTREIDNIKQGDVGREKKQKLMETKVVDDCFTPTRKDMGSQSYTQMHETNDDCEGKRQTYNCLGGSNASKYTDTKRNGDDYVSPNEFTVERTNQSENMSIHTSFEVTLKAYNVEKCMLNLPTEFSKPNLPHWTCYIKNFYADDKEWLVRFIYRNKSQSCLTKGWKSFVDDNKLQMGDVCVFELIKGLHPQLKVKIHRSADGENSEMYKDTSRNDGTDASPRGSIKEKIIESKNKSPPSSFKITLKPSNIDEHILNVPSYFTPPLTFDTARLIKLVDDDNNEWAVGYNYKPGSHALCEGWINFVRDKMLTVGDVCIFEPVSDDEFKLKVSISKSVE